MINAMDLENNKVRKQVKYSSKCYGMVMDGSFYNQWKVPFVLLSKDGKRSREANSRQKAQEMQIVRNLTYVKVGRYVFELEHCQ